MNKYEQEYYRNIKRIAIALEKIAKAGEIDPKTKSNYTWRKGADAARSSIGNIIKEHEDK